MATIAEPIPKRDDITKGIRNVFFRHLAHEGIMLDRMQRQLRSAEKLQKFAATGDTKDLATPGEDDMGVNIGNEYHVHNVMPEQKTTPAPSDLRTSIGSRLWPLVLGAALAGGSTGLGWVLAKWNTPAPVPAVDTDSDTITEIDFP